jgi:predicted Zn finger-like uncharacterized protein
MLIECDRCEATYDFPEDRIPTGGMRAKCAECGNVMQIGRAADAQSDAPPSNARPQTLEPAVIKGPPAKSQPPIDAPPPRRRDPTGQPSVIVDMGQLNDPIETAAAEQAAAQQLAFAPLATAPPIEMTPGSSGRHRVRDLPFGPEPSEIREIKPPSMGRWAVLGVVLALVGFAVFVGFANDFQPIWYEDPVRATKLAIGFEKPPPPPPPRVEKRELPPLTGELVTRDVEASMLRQGTGRRFAIVSGAVENQSNRVQYKISFVAELVDAETGLLVATRAADCCDVLDEAAAKDAAARKDHPHFAEGGRPDVRLAPGQRQPFVIVLRDLDPDIDRKAIEPKVRIRFAEAEQPAQ